MEVEVEEGAKRAARRERESDNDGEEEDIVFGWLWEEMRSRDGEGGMEVGGKREGGSRVHVVRG